MAFNSNRNQRYHGYFERKYAAYGLDWLYTTTTVETHHTKATTIQERKLTYRFYSHFHPYVSQLISELIEKSIAGLQAADTWYTKEELAENVPKPHFYEEFFANYNPNAELIPNTPEGSTNPLHPVKDLDFTSSGAYSVYNWELFFHVPLTIAIHLSKNQRFEDALRWFHYIFDPTDDSDGPTPERFWKVKPFQHTDVQMIEEVMTNLSSGADPKLLRNTINSIEAWKNDPFRPHVIARYRQSAYMFKAIFSYLDTLIAWGDSLFLQDTGESINEASQLYILAANILGPRPQEVPKKGSTKAQSYAQLRGELDAFSNALRDLEVDIPFDLAPLPSVSTNDNQIINLRSIGSTLYFCIPRNTKLIGYWDKVADRLFKIHNSLNLQGVFRQLPLFEPPIDPAMLARAAAAGLDIGAAISGLNQPLPLVRYRLMIQKAHEICQEVKSLGAGILAAIEKEDAEALSLIRAKHDSHIQELVEGVRYAQWQESIKAQEGLEVSLVNARQRHTYYERLLGKDTEEISIPELESLSVEDLEKQNFSSEEPTVERREIGVDIFLGFLDELGIDGLGMGLNTMESISLLTNGIGVIGDIIATVLQGVSAPVRPIPKVSADGKPLGVGAGAEMGGEDVSDTISKVSKTISMASDIARKIADIVSEVGRFQRRKQDWEFQSNVAAGEINQIYKQIVGAEIRTYIAEKEYQNHQQQIKNAKEVEEFLKGEKTKSITNYKKTSTKSFYSFLRRDVKDLHSKYFKFAYDIAKKAETALKHELGDPKLQFLKFDYLSGNEGLYAGEKLALDLRKMEMTYFDMNQRELELSKHISLRQLNPEALLQLKLKGSCVVSIPEEIFDMGGCEGHYFRRIKSVGLSIPCVVGPYTSINCTLTLTKSSIRKSSALLNELYTRQDDDDRFSDHFGSKSIVTSGAQNDSGMFEFNLNDERYLPFEYEGVISEWRLELADTFRQFDYNTISDVIFHINYMARQGGGLLKQGTLSHLSSMIQEKGRSRMFNLKHEFPAEWYKFISSKKDENDNHPLSITLLKEHYPFWSAELVKEISNIEIHTIATSPTVITDLADITKNFELSKNTLLGDNVYSGTWENISIPEPTGKIDLLLNNMDIENIWLIIVWKKLEN